MKLNPRHFLFLCLGYFFVIFNYPLIRASSTAYFFDAYGAKSTPSAWVWAVLVLSLCIAGLNRLQKNWGSQKLMFTTSSMAGLCFLVAWLFFQTGMKEGAYGFFVWKEVYIVLQVHLLLSYANSLFSREDFKKKIGWLAGSGSFGGMVGGLLTTWLADHGFASWIFPIGVLFVILPGIMVFFVPDLKVTANKNEAPLSSLDSTLIKKYVGFIILMTLLSQWVINIADFQFNLLLEKTILVSDKRASYLGQLYTYTNLLTLGFHVLILPVALKRMREVHLQFFIPLFYLLALALGFNLGGQLLWVSGGFYILLKSVDYSLFSGAKELLYQPMIPAQKYATKYLTDMLAYRAGKGLIALLLIYIQTPDVLIFLMFICLGLWIGSLFPLFNYQKKLFVIKD
jgi:ATP:ADP antiporter, AAA family